MELNDYYKLLELKHKFSEIKLFKSYLKKLKVSMTNKDNDEIIKVRMGFEVLRDEAVLQDYNRLYRKYILFEDLNFPLAKEQKMRDFVDGNEKVGLKIANEVIERKESFSIHVSKFLLKFIIADLSRMITLGFSGIIFIGLGVFVIFEFRNQLNLIGGALVILFGIYGLRRNIINWIGR